MTSVLINRTNSFQNRALSVATRVATPPTEKVVDDWLTPLKRLSIAFVSTMRGLLCLLAPFQVLEYYSTDLDE